jgi:hypothetical protein
MTLYARYEPINPQTPFDFVTYERTPNSVTSDDLQSALLQSFKYNTSIEMPMPQNSELITLDDDFIIVCYDNENNIILQDTLMQYTDHTFVAWENRRTKELLYPGDLYTILDHSSFQAQYISLTKQPTFNLTNPRKKPGYKFIGWKDQNGNWVSGE